MFKSYNDKFKPYELQSVSKKQIEADVAAVFSRIADNETEEIMNKNRNSDNTPEYSENSAPKIYRDEKTSPLKRLIPTAAVAAAIAIAIPVGANFFGGNKALSPAQSGVVSDSGVKILADAEYTSSDNYAPSASDEEIKAYEENITNYLGMHTDWESADNRQPWKIDDYELRVSNDGEIFINDSLIYKTGKVRTVYITDLTGGELMFLCSENEPQRENIVLFNYKTGKFYKLKDELSGKENGSFGLIWENNVPYIYEYEINTEAMEADGVALIVYKKKRELTAECFVETKIKPLENSAKPSEENAEIDLDAAISAETLKYLKRSYMYEGWAAEGHIILGSEEKDGLLNVYTLISCGCYGKVNDGYEKVSGCVPTPALFVFSFEKNGSLTLEELVFPEEFADPESEIKRLFPGYDDIERCLYISAEDAAELYRQEKSYIKAQ